MSKTARLEIEFNPTVIPKPVGIVVIDCDERDILAFVSLEDFRKCAVKLEEMQARYDRKR